jgi:hypothetical protein
MHQLFAGLGVLGTKPGGKGSGATANEDVCHPRTTSRTKPGGDTRPEGEGPVAKAPRLGRKPRGAMVAAVGRSRETVGLGCVTEDAAEPRLIAICLSAIGWSPIKSIPPSAGVQSNPIWLDLLTEPELKRLSGSAQLLWRTPHTTSAMLKGKTKSTLVMVCLWIAILGDRELSLCLGDGDVDSDVDGEAGEAACTGAVGRTNGTGRHLALGRGVLPGRVGGIVRM